MGDFSQQITTWFLANKRILPWRETRDPYRIWLSEVILQQTRIEQGLPYYHQFIDHFPHLQDLAMANEEVILKLWQGLGYYSRARNLHKGAKYIASKNEFPNTYKELLKVPGIGPYTAAAIASIAFEQAVPVIDGNVYRFASRHFNLTVPIPSDAARKMFSEVLQPEIENSEPGIFNQALMEMGSLICKPQKPNCNQCVVQHSCAAYQLGIQTRLPVKKSKTKVSDMYYDSIVILNNNQTFVCQRPSNGIWAKLYEFPAIEGNDKHLSIQELSDRIFKNKPDYQLVDEYTAIHKLTHKRIQAHFYLVEIQGEISFKNSSIIPVSLSDLPKFAVPRMVEKGIEAFELLAHVS